jgi:predicted alpha/beta hydrolase family esterase
MNTADCSTAPRAPRLLLVPGLHDSGPSHWQSWLQGLYRHSLRVVQRDWGTPDLERWSSRITSTLERAGPGPWIAAAHSFGCLALAHHLATQAESPLRGVLLVAPADPDRFGLAAQLPQQRLPVPSLLVGSQSDPWMSISQAHRWAQRWGSHWQNLGDAGHINTEAGFGPLPLARRWVVSMEQTLAREHRARHPEFSDWQFAV